MTVHPWPDECIARNCSAVANMSHKSNDGAAVSTSSKQTMGHGLLELFESVRGQKVTYKGVAGFHVPIDKLEAIEAQATELLRTGETTVSPATLLKLNSEIIALRAANDQANLALEASKAQVAARKGDIEQLQKSIKAKESIHASSYADYVKEVQEGKDKIAGLKADIELAKKSHGFEKESAEQTEANNRIISSLKSELTAAHKELESTRVLRKQGENDIEKLRKELSSQQAVNEETQRVVKRMEKTSFADVAKMPVHARELLSNEARLMKVLGPKALDWLRRADVTARENIRDRAYNLLQVARSSKDSKVSTLVEVLTLVMEHLRVGARKVSDKFRSFIDMLLEDIINLKVKTVQQYRDALAESSAALKSALAKAKEEAKPKPSRARERAHWVSTFLRTFFFGTKKNPSRLQLWVGRVKSLTRKGVKSLRATYCLFTSWLTKGQAEPDDDELIFDVDDESFQVVGSKGKAIAPPESQGW